MNLRRAPARPAGEDDVDHTITVLSIRPGRRHIVITLGPSLAVWTHWVHTDRGYRTMPCLCPRCPHCDTHRRIWRAYAPGAVLQVGQDGSRKWQRTVISIPQGIAWFAGEEYVCQTHVMSRRHQHANSPIECAPWQGAISAPLPASFNVEPVLRKIWGLRTPDDQHQSLEDHLEFGEL